MSGAGTPDRCDGRDDYVANSGPVRWMARETRRDRDAGLSTSRGKQEEDNMTKFVQSTMTKAAAGVLLVALAATVPAYGGSGSNIRPTQDP